MNECEGKCLQGQAGMGLESEVVSCKLEGEEARKTLNTRPGGVS